MADSPKEAQIRQIERLVNGLCQRFNRQTAALADTVLQLAGAREMLENAKKVK